MSLYWDPTGHLNMLQKSSWLKTLNHVYFCQLFSLSSVLLMVYTGTHKSITWFLQLDHKWKQVCSSLPTEYNKAVFLVFSSETDPKTTGKSLGQLCLHGTSAKAAENMKYCWIPGVVFPKRPFGIRMCKANLRFSLLFLCPVKHSTAILSLC